MASLNSKTENSGAIGAQMPRPPIVVVMGHVDHGKTTLLDAIRKTKIAQREAGGITQSIGAYEVQEKDQRITFIDTPGHQAFTSMRQRGAHVADVAILIVAADDGVQPQTQEAIAILKDSQTPFIVAINKIDKGNADIERTKNSLLANSVLLEKYGGDVPWVALSAKTGEGINDLLDMVLLVAHMESLTCDPTGLAKGFVLESKMDSQRGILASVVITDGTVRVGDAIAAGHARGKIKALENFMGKRVDALTPSSPALITGFDVLPAAGDEFVAGILDAGDAAMIAPDKKEAAPLPTESTGDQLRVIVKGDVSGSLEALCQMIQNLEIDGKRFRIMSQDVGDISDGDVKMAATFGAKIIGFNVKTSKAAELAARAQSVEMIASDVIYRIIEALEAWVGGLYKKQEIGSLEVLALFSKKDRKQLVGGKILSGFLTLNQRVNIVRAEQPIGQGRITNLQQGKKNVTKVDTGECGVMVESPVEVQVGDYLIIEK
ncbi:MAG: translation initiation factor IF-2 [Candidatus Paceibacterota bacterium]|jgi:translation initiation factor IF-2